MNKELPKQVKTKYQILKEQYKTLQAKYTNLLLSENEEMRKCLAQEEETNELQPEYVFVRVAKITDYVLYTKDSGECYLEKTPISTLLAGEDRIELKFVKELLEWVDNNATQVAFNNWTSEKFENNMTTEELIFWFIGKKVYGKERIKEAPASGGVEQTFHEGLWEMDLASDNKSSTDIGDAPFEDINSIEQVYGRKFRVAYGPQDVFTIQPLNKKEIKAIWLEDGKEEFSIYDNAQVILLFATKTWILLNSDKNDERNATQQKPNQGNAAGNKTNS